MKTLEDLSQDGLFYLTEIIESSRRLDSWGAAYNVDLLSYDLELCTPAGDHPLRQRYLSEVRELVGTFPDMRPADILVQVTELLTKWTKTLEEEV